MEYKHTMNNGNLELQFEEQIEELKDRLHECLNAPAGADAHLARGILEGLIADYQAQLAGMRAAARQVQALATTE